jgi:hypothetical protein
MLELVIFEIGGILHAESRFSLWRWTLLVRHPPPSIPPVPLLAPSPLSLLLPCHCASLLLAVRPLCSRSLVDAAYVASPIFPISGTCPGVRCDRPTHCHLPTLISTAVSLHIIATRHTHTHTHTRARARAHTHTHTTGYERATGGSVAHPGGIPRGHVVHQGERGAIGLRCLDPVAGVSVAVLAHWRPVPTRTRDVRRLSVPSLLYSTNPRRRFHSLAR